MNNNISTRTVLLSKTKIFLITIGSWLLVAISFWLTYALANMPGHILPPVLLKIIGIIGILVFSAGGVFGVFKLRDKKAGLVINQEGIYDNTSALSVGFIPWSDIIALKTIQVQRSKMLLIFVANQDQYIAKATGLKKRLMSSNAQMHGTPISIISSSLKCNYSEMEQWMQNAFNEAKKATS